MDISHNNHKFQIRKKAPTSNDPLHEIKETIHRIAETPDVKYPEGFKPQSKVDEERQKTATEMDDDSDFDPVEFLPVQ